MPSPIDILNEAMAAAIENGYPCTGWTLQADKDGYAAWLYEDNEESQQPLEESVEIHWTAESAAKACLANAKNLGFN